MDKLTELTMVQFKELDKKGQVEQVSRPITFLGDVNVDDTKRSFLYEKARDLNADAGADANAVMIGEKFMGYTSVVFYRVFGSE